MNRSLGLFWSPVSFAIMGMLFATESGQADETLWYGGDAVNIGSFNNTRLTQGTFGVCPEAPENACGTSVLDDFVVSGHWLVTGLFSNDLALPTLAFLPFTDALWTVGTGAGPGDFGQILFEGISPVTITPTGRSFGGVLEYTIAVSGLSLDLTSGDYFMSVSPLAQLQGYYVGVSNGTGSIGQAGPVGLLQENYEVVTVGGNPVLDYNISGSGRGERVSMGVTGIAFVPEPNLSPLLLLALVVWFFWRSPGLRLTWRG
ncbi:MAG: hypothetical protein JO323_22570 [Acidobacteriia bacterium]|nr:hypothetical protein [Terriglobia bacterium]